MKNNIGIRPNKPHIRTAMVIKMAVSNLRFKRFRSLVTILGVAIGIGSVYLLISFGFGLQNIVQGEIVGNKSINTIDITSTNSTIISLNPESVSQIESIAHITDLSGIYMYASQVTLDGSSADLVAYGVDALYLNLSDLNVIAGSLLDTEKTDEIVINSSLLESVGIDYRAKAINKEMTIKFSPEAGKVVDKKMRIVGVIDSGATGSEIFISQKVFQEAGIADFTQAKVVVDSRDSITDVRHAIESLGYETTSPADTLNQVNDVFNFFNLILVALGSVGLVIAVLGMINTLTVSLLERTREISLMIAIGARPKDMQRLFTTEALLLSLSGGIAGILLASGVGMIVNFILNQFASARGVDYAFSVFYAPPLLILGMLALMMLIGVLVSYVPARRAARINPIKALHQE